MKQVISIVVPCYNEEEALPVTAKKIEEKITALKKNDKFKCITDYSVYFVDDGSQDGTWNLIQQLNEENKLFCGIKLSRNKGHQNALLAGLVTAKETSSAVISMDADLQDDIDAIDEMLDKYLAGVDVVYGVRSSRATDTFFKRVTAQGFYKFLRFFSDNPQNIIYNHADYRLMSRRAIEGLESYSEINLFLRGIVPDIGYKQDMVCYERRERVAGESKYPLKKMWAFAVQGITSLSIKPMRLITMLGFLLFFTSLVMLSYFLIRHFTGHTVVGWSTLAVSVWGIGGLIQMSIGVCGEYIGKIYLETKRRPRFIIETILDKRMMKYERSE
ncbi:MAG: glycosyltransferase family 2 protein [Spirochaetaceae bacterium]|nr:glycosyltransferase family 2 protein [Spirochaetaceae bacterium]